MLNGLSLYARNVVFAGSAAAVFFVCFATSSTATKDEQAPTTSRVPGARRERNSNLRHPFAINIELNSNTAEKVVYLPQSRSRKNTGKGGRVW